MELLINESNPNTVINEQHVQVIYPRVISIKSTSTRGPYLINFVFGIEDDDNYISWEFDNPNAWLAALIDLGLAALTEQYIELIKDSGRDYSGLKS